MLEQYAVVSLVSFGFGAMSGYLARGFADKMIDKNNKKVDPSGFVLVVVTVIWALSMVVDIISPEYETSPLVHGLMGAIVGFFYKPFERLKK